MNGEMCLVNGDRKSADCGPGFPEQSPAKRDSLHSGLSVKAASPHFAVWCTGLLGLRALTWRSVFSSAQSALQSKVFACDFEVSVSFEKWKKLVVSDRRR